MQIKSILLFCIIFISSVCVSAQERVKVNSRYNIYTTESKAEILIYIPDQPGDYSFSLKNTPEEFEFPVRKGISKFKLELENYQFGVNRIAYLIKKNGQIIVDSLFSIHKQPAKSNAVIIDRLTGGLIVDQLDFFPFGFYTNMPVEVSRLAEEEVVNGFNILSPYQGKGTTNIQKRTYLDRCADLGLKVHYNICALVHDIIEKEFDTESTQNLVREISFYAQHPGLLAWYISDEPVGNNLSPVDLQRVYEIIKETDPYHPVSIVFMAPSHAWKYHGCMDIVMTDPYPIPSDGVLPVAESTKILHNEFKYECPIWVVPQEFGGQELWFRQPTAGEGRAMTYLSLVNHATGIQYFIRRQLNTTPNSTIAWAECGKMAFEFAEISPWIFSEEDAPEISSNIKTVQTQSWKKDNELLIAVVNTENKPHKNLILRIPEGINKKADVLFENRNVFMIQGEISEPIEAYGTKVYRIKLDDEVKDETCNGPNEIFINPGFEDNANIEIADGTSSGNAGDWGSTFYLDSRIAHRGNHSLRLNTPTQNKGAITRFYLLNLEAERSYSFSVWARTINTDARPVFNMKLGDIAEQGFQISDQWEKYTITGTLAFNNDIYEDVYPSIELLSKGRAWFDDIRVVKEPMIYTEASIFDSVTKVGIWSEIEDVEIHYSLEGKDAKISDTEYLDPFNITETTTITAIALNNKGEIIGRDKQKYYVNTEKINRASYLSLYHDKYPAGRNEALIDGKMASTNFHDLNWQGFQGKDLDVICDLGQIQKINSINIRFLRNHKQWIYAPIEVSILVSEDGIDYKRYMVISHGIPEYIESPYIQLFSAIKKVNARYIHLVARCAEQLPPDHPGAGDKAWMFVDEIIVE